MYLPLASLIVLGVLGAPTAPGVSVTLSTSDEISQAGTAEYTIHVRNDSSSAYPGLLIAQMFPKTMSYRDSSTTPSLVRPFEVQWRSEVAPHSEAVVRFRAAVGESVQTGSTVSTTACIRPSEETALICASAKDTVRPRSSQNWWWWIAGGAAVAIAGAGWWRRKRARPGHLVMEQ